SGSESISTSESVSGSESTSESSSENGFKNQKVSKDAVLPNTGNSENITTNGAALVGLGLLATTVVVKKSKRNKK
ncbi:LPXTG cell wall anchor domain-containing protein, partial [Leuconostoc rapi]